jgi:hypothetical protein
MGRSGNPAQRSRNQRIQRAMAEAGVGAVRARFYCDESGNTGAHWGDPDQPTFVHGGWLVPNRRAADLAIEVVELRRRHNLRAVELKWQQLARRSDSGAIFRDFFRCMTEHACLPFFWVMDKDFITCAKVIETFFDPAYNSHYPSGFSAARDIKKELAEAVSHSVDVRSRFAALMRTGERPTADEVRDLAARLADHFQAGNAPMLADSLRSFSDDAISQIQDELGSDDWLRSTVGHSLPGLTQLLEGFMRRRPVELDIVHDNLVRYEPAFDMIRGMFRPSDGSDVLLVGGEPFYGSMPTVTGLRLADSKTEPMIQMADLLCGFVRTVFTKIKNGVELSASELTVCFHLAMCRDELMVWDANMPERMWKEFARVTVGGAARGDVEIVL